MGVVTVHAERHAQPSLSISVAGNTIDVGPTGVSVTRRRQLSVTVRPAPRRITARDDEPSDHRCALTSATSGVDQRSPASSWCTTVVATTVVGADLHARPRQHPVSRDADPDRPRTRAGFDPPAGLPELEKPVDVRLPAVHYPDAQAGRQGRRADRSARSSIAVRSAARRCGTRRAALAAPADADASRRCTPLPLAYRRRRAAALAGHAGRRRPEGQGRAIRASPRRRAASRAIACAPSRPRFGAASSYAGVSAPSPELAFVEAAESQRFGVEIDTAGPAAKPRALASCSRTRARERRLPRDPRRRRTEVEIANCDAAGGPCSRACCSPPTATSACGRLPGRRS